MSIYTTVFAPENFENLFRTTSYLVSITSAKPFSQKPNNQAYQSFKLLVDNIANTIQVQDLVCLRSNS